MKILLVIPKYNPEDKVNYNYHFPLGLAYISATLKKSRYEVDCLNLNHLEGSINDILNKKLDSQLYAFVCTGGNTLTYSIIEVILNVAKNHKSKPKTIIGGPIITSEPEVIFEALSPDFGVIGEGEKTIIELLKSIEKNKELNKVQGIIYKQGGSIIITPKRKSIANLDSLPWPDFDGLEGEKQFEHICTNYNYYLNSTDYPRVYTLLSSRSCPFQCTFCYHYDTYRKRSLNNVMDELIANVKKYKINIIVIYDECFATDKERLYEFCKRLKQLKKEISWDLKWSCQLRVEGIDSDILKEMEESGCDEISYGFESFSPVVLKSMKKNIKPEQIDCTFKETLKAGIGVQANFIFGDIEETNETIKETLDYWKNNCKGQISLGYIQPYPNSQIYQHCLSKGLIKDKLDFIKNDLSKELWLNMTDKMSDEDIKHLKKEMMISFSKYVKFVVPKSIKKMQDDIYSMNVKCPFCNQMVKYENCYINNKLNYGFKMTCRNCHMRSYIVSFLRKVAYKYYPQIRAIRDIISH